MKPLVLLISSSVPTAGGTGRPARAKAACRGASSGVVAVDAGPARDDRTGVDHGVTRRERRRPSVGPSAAGAAATSSGGASASRHSPHMKIAMAATPTMAITTIHGRMSVSYANLRAVSADLGRAGHR